MNEAFSWTYALSDSLMLCCCCVRTPRRDDFWLWLKHQVKRRERMWKIVLCMKCVWYLRLRASTRCFISTNWVINVDWKVVVKFDRKWMFCHTTCVETRQKRFHCLTHNIFSFHSLIILWLSQTYDSHGNRRRDEVKCKLVSSVTHNFHDHTLLLLLPEKILRFLINVRNEHSFRLFLKFYECR